MRDLSTKEREALRKDEFAYVDSEGEEHLPIHDESHVRNAISRFNQTDFESKAAKERARKKILAAAERDGIEVDDDSKVREPRTECQRSTRTVRMARRLEAIVVVGELVAVSFARRRASRSGARRRRRFVGQRV